MTKNGFYKGCEITEWDIKKRFAMEVKIVDTIIGIFLHGQQGDVMTAMSVLKYRNVLWGGKHKIVWYISKENMDLLKYQDIEVREFPRGYGYAEMVKVENEKLISQGKEPIWEDWEVLCDENNHLNLELKNDYPSLKEFDYGYFPAPHQVHIDKRRGVPYPLVSKKVFGITDEYEWHPVLYFSDEERENAKAFISTIPEGKIIAIETMAGSSQSKITGEQIVDAMIICRRELGKCNFVFTSHKFINGDEQFPEGLINNVDTFSAAHFTVRQCALIIGMSNLMISVSSGTTVAASCWGNHPIEIIQFCGSYVCSTQDLSLGKFTLVTTDGKELKNAWKEFEMELIKILKTI